MPTSYAARTMIWSGPIIAAFVIFHVLHLTVGSVLPLQTLPDGDMDVRTNVIAGFQNPGVSGFYIFAMVLLCMHLYHGLWSMFQSLGLNHPRYTPMLKKGAAVVAWFVAIGNFSIPVAVMTGRVDAAVEERICNSTPKSPAGPIETRWDQHKFNLKLVNPANKRKYNIIVVGSGLAGGSAAATLAELGYNVKCFCFQDSPRRAHSIAAQGGINAAKNYHNDGDSVYRLFYDTVKGGDFRSREANVYRLAQISVNIIDQCVAQGVPFAREYGGYAG